MPDRQLVLTYAWSRPGWFEDHRWPESGWFKGEYAWIDWWAWADVLRRGDNLDA